MKLSNVIILTASLMAVFQASADNSNPFLRPEIKTVSVDKAMVVQPQSPAVNPYESSMDELEMSGFKDHFGAQKKFVDPRLSSETVVYRGFINGTHLYFDTKAREYIFDKSGVEPVKTLTTSLPALKDVNF